MASPNTRHTKIEDALFSFIQTLSGWDFGKVIEVDIQLFDRKSLTRALVANILSGQRQTRR